MHAFGKVVLLHSVLPCEKKPIRFLFLFVLAQTLTLQQDSVLRMDVGDGGSDVPSRGNRDGVFNQAKRKMKTPSQLEALEKAYSVSSTLSEQARQKLAQYTSLSSREISMWFANKRFQGKQAILLSEMKRKDAHPLTVHSLPSGSRGRSVPAAFHQMDSSRNQVFIGEGSTNISVQSQALQVIPQSHTSQYALDPLLLTYVETKLGGPLREDGPFVGMDFDPLPPGAFGTPFCIGNETMRKLEQPTQIPKCKSFLNLNAVSNKAIFQCIDSSHLQNSHRRTPADEFDCTVHPDSVYNLSSKLPCFPSEKPRPQTEEMLADYALQVDAQFVSHPVNAIVDKFVVTDTLPNDGTSQVERLHKGEEAQTANKVEALDILVACKKNCIKRKREMHNHEGKKGDETVIHEKQCDDNLQNVNQPGGCKKLLKKGNCGVSYGLQEKVRKPKGLHLEASATEEVDNKTFKAHGNVQRNLQLIDDEQLELMKIAASRKGLSSIDFLDKDTLDKLHTFQDMLGTFPPKSVIMKQAFAVPPWTECEENVGNLLMVWKFLVTFAGDFGLWPFTLEEFAQAFHDHDSRLLGEIHVALLKFIIRDLEDIKITRACALYVSEDNADNPERNCVNIVDGAHAWGFDINFWKKNLNFLTWPEILRQFALSAGYGPKLNKKAGYANHCGDEGVNDCDDAASFDNHVAGGISSALQKEKCSSCDSCHQLTPGTLEFAVFHALFLVGSKGLTSAEGADYINEHGLCDLTSMESAHASITNIMLSYNFILERAGLLRYRLKPCFRKDSSIAEKIFTGATENIHLCKNSISGLIVSDRKFQDLDITGENGCNLNSTKASTFLSNHHQNVHCRAGVINKSRFQNVDPVSSVILGCAEDEIILSTHNEELFDSIHELDSASGEIKRSELLSESWVQELTEGEYSSLSIEERLNILVALVGVIADGNLFHSFIEERLKEAQACKKMMWAKVRLNRRLQEERLNTDPIYFSKQVLNRSNIGNVSTQKEGLEKHFCFGSNCFLYEQSEHTPAVGLSELEVYIDRKVEMLHSYNFLPLGKDRRHNKYWQFSTSSSRNDSGSGRIFFESKDGFWKVIDSDEAFDAILSVLDTRGIRESHLYFMLKCIEMTFKDTIRSKNKEFCSESATERQATIVPDCCTYSAISITVPSACETLQSSASLNIDHVKNENESSSSKKYPHFMKWMWQECFNPDLLCAMRYGTKRCLQLLETCYICYQSYLAEERHCTSCHVTFDICNNVYENFSAHLAICEANFKIQLSIPFCPISIQLLKAQLAIIEASIPMEAFHPFWNDSYRKSWGTKLKLSSSAKEIFQNLTLLEGAILPAFLCSDFVTTNELLRSEENILLGTRTVSELIPVIPWIPDTSAAVALRLLDLDASIPYMLQHGLELLEGTEDGEFLVLPRSKVVNPVHQVESTVSEDSADRNVDHRKHEKDGAGKDSCTGMEHRILGKHNSELEDFSDGSHGSKVDTTNESSGSLQGVQTPAVSSYEMNAGSANIYAEAGAWDREDESETGDEFGGGGEAVESNECHRWQETADDSYSGSEEYVDEHQSEAGYLKDEVINVKGSIKSAVRKEHSFSSVNTN